MVDVKVLSTDCSRCRELEKLLDEVLAGLPAGAVHSQKVSDITEIAAFGVLAVPALLINGEVKSVGNVPAKAVLTDWLTKALEGEKE